MMEKSLFFRAPLEPGEVPDQIAVTTMESSLIDWDFVSRSFLQV